MVSLDEVLDPNQKRHLADVLEIPDRTIHKRTENHFNVVEQWLEPGADSETLRKRAQATMRAQHQVRGPDGQIGVWVQKEGEDGEPMIDPKTGLVVMEFHPEELAPPVAKAEESLVIASRGYDIRTENIRLKAIKEGYEPMTNEPYWWHDHGDMGG